MKKINRLTASASGSEGAGNDDVVALDRLLADINNPNLSFLDLDWDVEEILKDLRSDDYVCIEIEYWNIEIDQLFTALKV